MMLGHRRFFTSVLLVLWLVTNTSGKRRLEKPSDISNTIIYYVDIRTTDTARVLGGQSFLNFRLSVFGRRGELGKFIPAASPYEAFGRHIMAEKDIGEIYEAAVYTVNMSDPWHLDTITIIKGDTGRMYCFQFDRWIGWDNRLIWKGCENQECQCKTRKTESYMFLVEGPMQALTKISIFGSKGIASHKMEGAIAADAWQAWLMPNVGDIQKIGVRCMRSHPAVGTQRLTRIMIGVGRQRHIHCFTFNASFCDPSKPATHYLEKKCANSDCSC